MAIIWVTTEIRISTSTGRSCRKAVNVFWNRKKANSATEEIKPWYHFYLHSSVTTKPNCGFILERCNTDRDLLEGSAGLPGAVMLVSVLSRERINRTDLTVVLLHHHLLTSSLIGSSPAWRRLVEMSVGGSSVGVHMNIAYRGSATNAGIQLIIHRKAL